MKTAFEHAGLLDLQRLTNNTKAELNEVLLKAGASSLDNFSEEILHSYSISKC